MSKLAAEECTPCKGSMPALKSRQLRELHAKIGARWRIVLKHHLEKEFKFKNFLQALAFTNKVGALAERAGHHPDIYLAWGKVRITIWTHKVDGLTESDFILAAKIDAL